MHVTRLLEFLFGCQHSSLSRVFTIGTRTYCVCHESGAEFDYSLEKMASNRSYSYLALAYRYRNSGTSGNGAAGALTVSPT